ncbi:hypothetical protein JTE90_027440 [Oedothorax gibbosus]|uniref:Uncharacterized protein n=1 Tax=Oedothorax gibbosus TaxID=931172 RepID=A0AAV6VZC5_9ARAC|nr:hypothetical protein JTE90_027440 [Oedothorax gibbosus]
MDAGNLFGYSAQHVSLDSIGRPHSCNNVTLPTQIEHAALDIHFCRSDTVKGKQYLKMMDRITVESIIVGLLIILLHPQVSPQQISAAAKV